MSRTHVLKIKQEFYDDVKRGIKTAEVRLNDRNFVEGDILILSEWDGEKYTGRQCIRAIAKMYNLDCIGLENWVLLCIV